jgi:hypothetical protein
VTKKQAMRWLLAVAILVTGILASFYAAEWLQTVLGLPSFTIISRRGVATDLVVLALAICLFIGYLYIVPKVLRVSHEDISRMMRGE